MKFFTFFGIQTVAAIFGAFLVWCSVPHLLLGTEKGGVTMPNLGESVFRAFFLELFLSYFLVLVVLSVRTTEKRLSSILLSFGYTAARLVSFPLTNGALNPARSIGHAVVALSFDYLWLAIVPAGLGAALGTSTFVLLHRRDLQE